MAQAVKVSLYDGIGFFSTLRMVWSATPLTVRLIGWPYGFATYRHLLQRAGDLDELHDLHRRQYRESLVFRVLRPRYGKIEQMLRSKGVRARD
ncbi:MAG: hypothetical protein FJ039_11460 [Chloroflexi bacterium]|nr:hypothetical protein [Chloroflexota bacterium]